MATWDEVHDAAVILPEVEADGRSWRIRGKALAWERPLRKADHAALGAHAPTGPILGIRTVDLAAKEELLAAWPDVLFTTPHFDGYPAVLARLEPLDPELLRALLEQVWLVRAPKKLVRAYVAAKAAP